MDTQELQKLKNKYDIIGNNAAYNMALETAIKVAPVDITVLVSGESGVGKEIFPQIIHQNSRRKTNKYFAVNCGAIPEGTMDSELFGHVKGSFTGAIEARKGYFEEADGGTLFLDEIGELPMESQAKLLRVLQSGEYIKVGSSKVEKTDVRVIAATNVNLEYAVAQGKFREDLYYRLNAVQIKLPALRDRKDDIPLLFRKFASDFSEQNSRRKISLTSDATKLLISYRWPGNIRQLKNVAEVVSAIESPEADNFTTDRFEITADVLQRYMPQDTGNTLPALVKNPQSTMSDNDKMQIFEILHQLTNEVNKLKAMVETNPINHIPESTNILSTPSPHIDNPTISKDVEWAKADSIIPPKVEIKNSYGEVIEGAIDDQAISTSPENEVYSLRENYIELIKKALEKHDGNRKKAAKELGISERTLYRKLSKINLEENEAKN